MGREPVLHRISPLTPKPCGSVVSCGISSCFQLLSPCMGQIAHALLTRPPLEDPRKDLPARLACVRHAASVRPEPGSNSYVQSFTIFSSLPLPQDRCLSQKSDCSSCLSFSLYRFQGSLSSVRTVCFSATRSLAATGDSIAKTPGFVNTFFHFLSSYYMCII